jgi:hypothetical protein
MTDERITEEYPGLFVWDSRVGGSITLGHTRLPLWALLPRIIGEGYSVAKEDWELEDGTDAHLAEFLGNLFQQRKDWARLLLLMAQDGDGQDVKDDLRKVLLSCLADLEERG